MSEFHEGEEIEDHDDFSNNVLNNNNCCSCLDSNISTKSNNDANTERKNKILTVTKRTEEYLRTRRIPELIHYLMTKLLAHMPDNPAEYLENILDECMLFRAGHGKSPVIYEDGHLRAVIKSYDPSNLGWFSVDQAKLIFSTLGLPFDENEIKCKQNRRNITTNDILAMLQQCQQEELLQLFDIEDTNGSEI